MAAERLASLVCVVAAGAGAEELEAAAEEAVRALQVGLPRVCLRICTCSCLYVCMHVCLSVCM